MQKTARRGFEVTARKPLPRWLRAAGTGVTGALAGGGLGATYGWKTQPEPEILGVKEI